jgi:hypothetical protein
MVIKRFIIYMFFILVCANANAENQENSQVDADLKELATKYYSSYAAFDWEKLASLMVPEELSDVAGIFKEIAEPLGVVDPNATDVEAFGALYDWYFKMSPDAKDYTASHKAKVLGIVRENKKIAHLVMRVDASFNDYAFSDVEILTAVKNDGEWKFKVTDKINVFKKALNKSKQ